MKKVLSIVGLCIVAAVLVFLYVTRPASAPTKDINSVSAKLPADSAVSDVYRISQTGSLVTFTMNETLNGKPFLVVGTTTQIGGDIEIKDTKLVLGELTLNAKTLETDNSRRNGAITRLILKSENPANEFITFKPTSYDGATAVETGTSLTFNVLGDLTISGVTKPATFKVTARVTSEQVTGTAETTIKRSDFGLVIPTLSFVADVDDAFPVTVSIVANRIMR